MEREEVQLFEEGVLYRFGFNERKDRRESLLAW